MHEFFFGFFFWGGDLGLKDGGLRMSCRLAAWLGVTQMFADPAL